MDRSSKKMSAKRLAQVKGLLSHPAGLSEGWRDNILRELLEHAEVTCASSRD